MFKEEFVKAQNLTEDQVTAITGEVNNFVADEKKTIEDIWKAKSTQDADAIITGATKKVEELTGIKREHGQKAADYLTLASEKYLEGSKASLERKQIELEDKIKNTSGSEALKAELEETKTSLDKLKQRDAILADWETNDYKGKYEKLSKDMSAQNIDLAFNSVKPSFPDTVNSYESTGRWKEFINNTLEKYDIVRDNEGESYAVDKENIHKRLKLKDLVEKDENITKLKTGRTQTGLGGNPKDKVKIEGVPFEVAKEATPAERQAAVRDYLLTVEKLPQTSTQYAKRFAELNKTILEKTPSH